MSKYTVELRELINQGTDLGLKNYPIWSEEHREVLNQKIINHYKYREIAFETPGRFIDELNIKMDEIMPYYIELYNTTMYEYNPLHNVDYTEEYTINRDTTGNVTNTSEGSSESVGSVKNKDVTTSEASESSTVNTESENTSNLTTSTDHKHKKVDIDTPQSNVNVDNILDSYPYASNVSSEENDETSTKTNTDTNTTSNTSEGTSESEVTNNFDSDTTSSTDMSNSSETDSTEKQVETYSKHLVGNYGVISSQRMIQQQRDLIINIDVKIIAELHTLFMQVW